MQLSLWHRNGLWNVLKLNKMCTFTKKYAPAPHPYIKCVLYHTNMLAHLYLHKVCPIYTKGVLSVIFFSESCYTQVCSLYCIQWVLLHTSVLSVTSFSESCYTHKCALCYFIPWILLQHTRCALCYFIQWIQWIQLHKCALSCYIIQWILLHKSVISDVTSFSEPSYTQVCSLTRSS
jgi:hypothetical protein